MTTDVDIITALVHKLDHENARLRAENADLRDLVDMLGKHVTIPSEHIRIKGAPDIWWKGDDDEHQPYAHAVLPDGRVVPYEEAKHIKDGDTPPRLTIHKLNVAPVGSVAIKSPGSIFAPLRKVHSGKWVTVGDELTDTRPEWSAEDLIEYGWADATLHLGGARRPMTAREQLETEAAELYPLDRWQRMANGEPFPRPEQAAHVRAKTVTAEQLEAAVASMREQSPDSAPNWLDWVWHRYVRAAFRAAGFLIEGDDDVSEA